MKKYLSIILLMLITSQIFALSAGNTTRITKSPNGKYIFVFLSPHVSYESDSTYFTKAYTIENAKIRAKYKQTGIYRSKDAKLMWAISDAPTREYLMDDGDTMIAFYQTCSASKRCLAFYLKGEMIKQYTIKDLVAFPFLCKSYGCTGIDWIKTDGFIKNGTIYTISTQPWGKYSFNLKTGEIISTRKILLIIFASFVILIGIVSIFVHMIMKKRTKDKKSGRPE